MNVWLKLAEQVYMPTNLTEDREVEFTFIKRSLIARLREYWTWHLNQGSISEIEHEALFKMIEIQSGDNPYLPA